MEILCNLCILLALNTNISMLHSHNRINNESGHTGKSVCVDQDESGTCKPEPADNLQTVLQDPLPGQTSEVKGKNFSLYYQQNKHSNILFKIALLLNY